MSPALRKEFRIVWLPLAIACFAAFVCGGRYVNDPQAHLPGEVAYDYVVLRHAAEWCPGMLCISLAVLAGLVFGVEYQQRTLQLLLTQPLPRSRIWNQKSAMLATCAVAIVLAWFVGTRASLHYHWGITSAPDGETTSIDDILLPFAAFFIATLCSAAYWSLVTRSVLGGIVLNAGFQALTGLCIALIAEKLFKIENAWRIVIYASPIYALMLLILGRQKFLRLQVASPFGSEQGFSEAFARLRWNISWMRPARRGAFANLLRKEVRLNKPLFVIAGSYLVACLLAFFVLGAAHVDKDTRESVIVGVCAFYMCIVFGLAGSVSLGEEKAMGTHTGQLILPVAKWKLLIAKLLMAFLICIVLGLILPGAVMTISFVVGEWDVTHDSFSSWLPILGCIALTLIGFWAAAHFSNSITAVLATVLFLPVMGFSAVLGHYLAGLARLSTFLSMPFGIERPFLAWLTLKYHLSPWYLLGFVSDPRFFLYSSGAICLLLLIQSIKEFGAVQPHRARTLRHIVAIFVFSTLAAAWYADLSASATGFAFVAETKRALARAIPKTAAGQAPDKQPVNLPITELEQTGDMPLRSIQWLRGSVINVSRFTRHRANDLYDRGYGVQILFPHGSWTIDLFPEQQPASP